MAEKKKPCLQYSSEFLGYGFIESPNNITKPLCLLCFTELSNDSMRASKLQYYLESKHPDKKGKSLNYFKKLRDNFQKRSTLTSLFSKCQDKKDKGLIASYKISKLIAETGKPHTIGEDLILPSISVAISTVMEQSSQEIIGFIPLSNNTISRHIDEMAGDIENQLIAVLQKRNFALQIDETLLPDNQAILMAYVRFLDDKSELIEEMLFARSLATDTKGATIFKEVSDYFQEKNIPMGNIIACATDGAAAMVGSYRGFMAYLKETVPNVFCIHCVVHRQHLVAKQLGGRLKNVLDKVIKVVNCIKSNPLQDRLFHQLCDDNEQFKKLILHTEVRWLSKGNCLGRFVELWQSIELFLNSSELGKEIVAAKSDIFYLSDIFEKLNMLNKQLQGKNSNIINCKEAISAFLTKLHLFSTTIGHNRLPHFPNLSTLEELHEDDIFIYINHLKNLHDDMAIRFKDILKMEIPSWVVDPFETNAVDVDIILQESLIELQCNETARAKFKHGFQNLWTSKEIAIKFPLLWEKVKIYMIAFPTTYLVESGFSKVAQLLSKNRNRFEVTVRGDLRLSLTNLKPNIDKLSKMHQGQGSH